MHRAGSTGADGAAHRADGAAHRAKGATHWAKRATTPGCLRDATNHAHHRDNVIYLDNNATTAIDPQVADAVADVHRRGPMNASSQHAAGRAAAALLADAIESIGHHLGSRIGTPGGPRIVITSGGTEANHLGLAGWADGVAGRAGGVTGTDRQNRRDLCVSAVEHPCVMETAAFLQRQRGVKVHVAPVDGDGVVDVAAMDAMLDEYPIGAVAVMSANNETGVIQPIHRVAERCRQRGVWLHVDATQTIGKLPFEPETLGVDSAVLSAHKFHGPTGVGALYLGPGRSIAPTFHGGGQQLETRPGTEPVAAVVGMATALDVAMRSQTETAGHCRRQRDRLESAIREAAPSVVIQGGDAPRLPGTTCLSLVGADRQSFLMALDMASIAASSGSACSSGSAPPSHVLIAMGRPETEIQSAIRFGVSKFTTDDEIETAVKRILKVYARLKK